MAMTFPNNLKDFAKDVVWYDCEEKYIQTETSYKHFLVFLLSRGTDEDISYVRDILQVPDEDFIDALKNAKPGVFLHKANWYQWNREFNIEPAIPFPIKWPERFGEKNLIPYYNYSNLDQKVFPTNKQKKIRAHNFDNAVANSALDGWRDPFFNSLREAYIKGYLTADDIITLPFDYADNQTSLKARLNSQLTLKQSEYYFSEYCTGCPFDRRLES